MPLVLKLSANFFSLISILPSSLVHLLANFAENCQRSTYLFLLRNVVRMDNGISKNRLISLQKNYGRSSLPVLSLQSRVRVLG